jgi:hypothetical protein
VTTYRRILITLLSILPMVLMAQPTKTVRLDFPPSAIGSVDEREVRIDNLPPGSRYVVIDTCDAPFRLSTPPNELTVKNGELRVRCEFAPTSPGTYRDELFLEQRPQTMPPGERIRIRLSGTGFRIERVDRVEFADVLIGDSTRKVVLIRDDFLRDVRWSLTRLPLAPFGTPDTLDPYRPDRDTIGFRFTYVPTAIGRSRDTIGLIRTYMPTNVALDTIVVILDGNAVRMKDSAEILFANLSPGMTVTSDLSLPLPATPRTRSFTYKLRAPTAVNVVTGNITDPLSASRTSIVRTSFTAAPQSTRDVREQFVLLRSGTNGLLIDSTIITARVTMKPQPVELRASFTSDTLVHRIGDTVTFEIIATSERSLVEPITLTNLIAECEINSTVIVPLVNDDVQEVTRDDRAYVRITAAEPVTLTQDSSVVLRWNGVVVLGNAGTSPLNLGLVTASLPSGQRITLSATPSVLRVSNVWIQQDGTPRLINPRAAQLTLDIAPNPITATGTITIDSLPAGTGRLDIVDARGIVVMDLTQQLRTGRREFSVSTSGGVDATLLPGLYYARLTAQLLPQQSISSVVRPFVLR